MKIKKFLQVTKSISDMINALWSFAQILEALSKFMETNKENNQYRDFYEDIRVSIINLLYRLKRRDIKKLHFSLLVKFLESLTYFSKKRIIILTDEELNDLILAKVIEATLGDKILLAFLSTLTLVMFFLEKELVHNLVLIFLGEFFTTYALPGIMALLSYFIFRIDVQSIYFILRKRDLFADTDNFIKQYFRSHERQIRRLIEAVFFGIFLAIYYT